MRILQLFALIFCISIFSSCEILKQVANDELDKRLACIPVTGTTYNKSYRIVAEKRSQFDKLKSAKRETTDLKCMTNNQIYQFAELMSNQHLRLEYAKYAYEHSSNPEDYYLDMRTLFSNSFIKQELEEYTRKN